MRGRMGGMNLIVGIVAPVIVIALGICGTWLVVKDAIDLCRRLAFARQRKPKSRLYSLAQILVRINFQVRAAEALTVSACDDDTLQRAAKLLMELKKHRRDVEAKLRGE